MVKARRREKKKKNRFLAIIVILFIAIVLTTSTYAWFTANRTVTVEGIDVNVSTSTGLQISTDAVNWKSVITNTDIKNANWTGVKNQIPVDSNAVPVSTIGTLDENGLMEMYKGTIETSTVDSDNILTAVKSTEVKGLEGDFVAFDLFFQSSEAQTVYLTSRSNVVARGDVSTGIENAARVAFIREGDVEFGSTPAEAQALKTSDNTNGNLLIWEPNYDVHTAAGVSNALTVYDQTVNQTGASKLSYYGVKAPIAKANDVKLNSTSDDYFAPVTTVGSVAAGIPASTYINAFNVAEGVTKIRIYMWIEGQDVDCEDHASGGELTYNLQFSIDSSSGA